jgi:hypothetical protein
MILFLKIVNLLLIIHLEKQDKTARISLSSEDKRMPGISFEDFLTKCVDSSKRLMFQSI